MTRIFCLPTPIATPLSSSLIRHLELAYVTSMRVLSMAVNVLAAGLKFLLLCALSLAKVLIDQMATSVFGTMVIHCSRSVVRNILRDTSTMYYVVYLVLVDITTTFYLQNTYTLVYLVGLLFISLLFLVALLNTMLTVDANTPKNPIITKCEGSSNNGLSTSLYYILLPFIAWFTQYTPHIEGNFTVDSAIMTIQLLGYFTTVILVLMFATVVLLELFNTPKPTTSASKQRGVSVSSYPNFMSKWASNAHGMRPFSTIRQLQSDSAVNEFDMDEIHRKVHLSKDHGGPTSVPHFIAKRHIDAKLPPTVAIINEVLTRQNIAITEEDLALFASLKPFEFTMPIKRDKNNSSRFKEVVGASNATTSVAGVYIWTNLATNRQYVGSSVALQDRVRSYYTKGYNQSSIAKEIRANPSNFRLTVYTLPQTDKRRDLCIALEQYFFFIIRPQINSHLEAGTRGGKKEHDRDVEYFLSLRQDKSQWVHFYNKERTQRHLSFSTQGEAERALDSVFTRRTLTVYNNSVLWGSYWISNEILPDCEYVPLSKDIVRDTLAKGKAMSYKNRPRSPGKPLSQPRVSHGPIYYIDPIQKTAQLYKDVGTAADSISESLNVSPVNARTHIRLALRGKGRAYNKVFVKQSEFESHYNVTNGFYQFKASEYIPEHWPM